MSKNRWPLGVIDPYDMESVAEAVGLKEVDDEEE